MEGLLEGFRDRALGAGAGLATKDVFSGTARKALSLLEGDEGAELLSQLSFDVFSMNRLSFHRDRIR